MESIGYANLVRVEMVSGFRGTGGGDCRFMEAEEGMLIYDRRRVEDVCLI